MEEDGIWVDVPGENLNRTVLRGVIQYKFRQGASHHLLHFNYLHPNPGVKLKDMRPPTATGKLELLERLAGSLVVSSHEGVHSEWVTAAKRYLAEAKEAMNAGDIEAAVSNAIDGVMLIGDLAAEIHIRSVFRDMKRQKGTVKGGKASRLCKGILLAAGRLRQDHPDWSAAKAWNQLMLLESATPMTMGGYEIFADGDVLCQRDEKTGDDQHIRKATFRSYWTATNS